MDKWTVLAETMDPLIPYRLNCTKPSVEKLKSLEAKIQGVEPPVREVLCLCVRELSSLPNEPCRVKREHHLLQLTEKILALLRGSAHPDYVLLLPQIQRMYNNIREYISQSQ
jgi:hypothetical protein